MRGIKFRFWTGSKMIYMDSSQNIRIIMGCLDQQLKWNLGFKRSTAFDHVGDYDSDFQQYVGLNDINGKGIYEGDIIESLAGNGLIKTGELIKVSQMDAKGCYPFVAFPEIYVWDNDECIVIGNIHENQKLLKEKNA